MTMWTAFIASYFITDKWIKEWIRADNQKKKVCAVGAQKSISGENISIKDKKQYLSLRRSKRIRKSAFAAN